MKKPIIDHNKNSKCVNRSLITDFEITRSNNWFANKRI